MDGCDTGSREARRPRTLRLIAPRHASPRPPLQLLRHQFAAIAAVFGARKRSNEGPRLLLRIDVGHRGPAYAVQRALDRSG